MFHLNNNFTTFALEKLEKYKWLKNKPLQINQKEKVLEA